jgi:hypothetical protein
MDPDRERSIKQMNERLINEALNKVCEEFRKSFRYKHKRQKVKSPDGSRPDLTLNHELLFEIGMREVVMRAVHKMTCIHEDQTYKDAMDLLVMLKRVKTQLEYVFDDGRKFDLVEKEEN